MSPARKVAAVIMAALVVRAAPVAADFVIELRDGGRLEANFVRSDGEMIHASRVSGEVAIPREQVTSIEEVEPGRILQEATTAPAHPSDATGPSGARSSVDEIRERERRVTREIILGRRELLFARLRGDDLESIDTRREKVEALERRRAELRNSLPTWELAR